ncbi:transaldolase family protein [Hydrogenophaga sp.]|uniref:transaldolase family protein n=1 Tax=Hydrogenophaga sp. TaxID=1904254 RepID=UPI00263516D4|nr:transaldolase family protein [Hydrogenophaga sp.]MCW5654851.1 hypothetical protein [Hydrogenophaga sp.]
MLLLNQIAHRSPHAEVWWDSMPSSFVQWRDRLAETLPERQRELFHAGFAQLIGGRGEGSGLLKGSTTNPRLFLESLLMDPERTRERISRIAASRTTATDEDIYWQLYMETFADESRLWLEHWRRSGGSQGWVCAQMPPVSSFDTEALVAQGVEMAAVSPNLMIKVVGSKQGYEAIEALAARGISINNTLSFSVPQFVRALDALKSGYAQAQANGVDLTRWRAVITYMVGRLGAEEEFTQQARERGIELTVRDIRWAEMALFQRIQPMVEALGLPIKMLLCSLRVDKSGTARHCFHIEQSIGSDCVYTIPPAFFLELFESGSDRIPPGPAWGEPVPGEVMDKLMRIPYFCEAYEPDGMPPEAFCFHPAFITGLKDVNAAYRKALDIVRTCR